MCRIVYFVFLIFLVLGPAKSFGWRETGHFTVCEIAYRNLAENVRIKLDTIFDGKDFAIQCTWPDTIRSTKNWACTYNWHFINLEDDQEYFDPQYLSPTGDILRALLLADEKLRSGKASLEGKRIYLRFLGHFTGDSHQPLHTGRKSDLGGNKIKVSWFGEKYFNSPGIVRSDSGSYSCERESTDLSETVFEGMEKDAAMSKKCSGEGLSVHPSTGECLQRTVKKKEVSLHKVWDLLMLQKYIEKNGLKPEPGDSAFLHKAYASELEKKHTLKDEALLYLSYWNWVDESLKNRVRAYTIGDGKLEDAYYEKNIDYLNERIFLAGRRLAVILNGIFSVPSTHSPEVKAQLADIKRLREKVEKLVQD